MPRPLRIEYEGAVCQVMSRGDRREPIFRDDADRQRFLETLGEASAKTDWQVHALCLMGNHFHLVVETPQGNLVAGMSSQGGGIGAGRTQEAVLGRPGAAAAAQGRSCQGAHRATTEAGDDHDAGVDRAAIEHGRVDACVESAAVWRHREMTVSIVRTDP
jgi:Transposase IS200 like